MTGPAQSIGAGEAPEPGEASDPTEPTQQHEPGRRGPSWFAAVDSWRGIGWLACGVAVGLVLVWFIFLSRWEIGSKAEWFSGAGVFGAVAVAMWQTLNIQRQAKQDAADAAERLRKELAAAEERSTRELALTQTLHRVEMDAQRELARVERVHLLDQQQKQAMIEVSRAVSAHTQSLATLWNEGAHILRIEDRDEREQAMNPVFEQTAQVVSDFSVELVNAHLFIEDDRLHQALNRVNEAALMAIRVAEDVHVAVVEGCAPHPNPIPPVQRLMHRRAAEARRLAWELLRTGLDDGGGPTG
jgi:hypothetical protein